MNLVETHNLPFLALMIGVLSIGPLRQLSNHMIRLQSAMHQSQDRYLGRHYQSQNPQLEPNLNLNLQVPLQSLYFQIWLYRTKTRQRTCVTYI